jgi:Double zinc ribbon
MASPQLACPSCGTGASAQAKFCSKCGVPLKLSVPTNCSRCGASVAPDAKFCTSCGCPVAAAAVATEIDRESEAQQTEKSCADCKHRQPRFICGSPASPRYQQTVDAADSCDSFLLNPAIQHETNGLTYALEGGRNEEAVREFQTAISIGLPQDDELSSRFSLAGLLLDLAVNQCNSVEQLLSSPLFNSAVEEGEKAVQIDRDARYGYFSQPLHRAQLRRLDSMYILIADSIAEKQSGAAAIKFLQPKIGLSAYLPSTPFLQTLMKLGEFYLAENQKGSAKVCFANLVSAEPVDRSDEKGKELALRQQASEYLRSLP